MGVRLNYVPRDSLKGMTTARHAAAVIGWACEEVAGVAANVAFHAEALLGVAHDDHVDTRSGVTIPIVVAGRDIIRIRVDAIDVVSSFDVTVDRVGSTTLALGNLLLGGGPGAFSYPENGARIRRARRVRDALMDEISRERELELADDLASIGCPAPSGELIASLERRLHG